ncbi:hypothetical protein OK016_28940 [Vibrio chagasii]|nr:hypothetical protein [Vibrio chagasii]
MSRVDAKDRDLAMRYSKATLYPHMTVYENASLFRSETEGHAKGGNC